MASTRNVDQHTVNLEERTCSCGAWDVNVIQCVHVAVCMIDKRDILEDYLAPCFKRVRHESTYAYALQPIRGPNAWEKGDQLPISPPDVRVMPGRPKLKRIKEFTERRDGMKISKQGGVSRCSRCKQ